MTTQLSPPMVFQAIGPQGPSPFAKLYTYAAGTSTPQATYTDSTGGTPNTNPVIMNSYGQASVWLDPTLSYKFVLTDEAGNQLATQDNIQGNLAITGSLIPASNNLFDLGSASDEWRNGYFGTQLYIGTTPVLNGGNVSYWARTAAEIAASVTPVNYAYAPGAIERYGADMTGVADSSTAVANALKALPTAGGKVFSALGGILKVAVSTQLDLVANSFLFDLTGCQVTTSLASGAVFTFGSSAAGAAKQNCTIRGGYYYINNTSVDAFGVYKCQNLVFETVWVYKANRAFNIDGTVNSSGRILDVKWTNCYTGTCTVGYRLNAQSPLVGSYDCFAMDTCASESDATGVAIIGEASVGAPTTLTINNSEIQNSGTAGISCSGATLIVDGTYIETSAPLTIPSISASTSSSVTVGNGSVAAYPSIDSTSWITYKNGASNELGVVQTESRCSGGALGDNDSANGWGPPNYPIGKAGFQSALGFTYRDSQGIDWTCTFAGQTSGSSPYVKFMPLDNPCDIIIPVAYNTNLSNGNLIWFPQMDFVIEEVMLLVTTAFTGGTSISFGNATYQQALISSDSDQGAVANLTLGKYITSRRNHNAGAQLAGGNTLVWPGNEYNASSGTIGVNGLYSLVSGTFTAGAGKLIVRGYRPRLTVSGDNIAGNQLHALTNQVATTIGAPGAASALPANPLKYLRIVDSTGTVVSVPAYNP